MSSGSPTRTIPVCEAVNGRVVGRVIVASDEAVFEKKVRSSTHLFRMYDGWGIDRGVWRAIRRHITAVRVLDLDEGLMYEVGADTFDTEAKEIDYGHGKQLVLPRRYWAVSEFNRKYISKVPDANGGDIHDEQ